MSENQTVIIPKDNLFGQMGVTNVSVQKIIFNERRKRMDLICDALSPRYLNEVEVIYEKIKQRWPDLEIDFKIRYKEEKVTSEDIKDITERAIKRLKEKNAISKSFLYFYRIFVTREEELIVIHLELNNEMAVQSLLEQKLNYKLEEIIKNFGVRSVEVRFDLGDFSKEVSRFVELTDVHLEELAAEETPGIIDMRTIPKPNERKVSFPGSNQDIKISKGNPYKGFMPRAPRQPITGSSLSIDECYALMPDDLCIVEGSVFDYSEIITKNKNKIARFGITDEKNSIYVKIFLDPSVSYADAKFIKARGKIQTYKISDEKTEYEIMASDVNPLSAPAAKIEDAAPEKMVELHTHTKMSEMAGICDSDEIIRRAVAYGHKAVALTDYSVVHAFPHAWKTAREYPDFKLILGCEISLVNDLEPVVWKAKDMDFEEETFVVFDLETLGLNVRENPILEIGAVKLKGTRIIDRFSRFVNPRRPIPDRIRELTGIEDGMVQNEPGIEEVLPAFLEFAGDATMVAHNAAFDIGFIRRDVQKIMGCDYNPSVIDTISLAKAVYPGLKSYGLGPLNKLLGLSLEKHHRAVDDAQATALMFTIFLEKYREAGAKNLRDFEAAFPRNIKNAVSCNCMVLVKNSTGLRNLYELISRAHLDFYGNKKPKIPKSLLQEKREGLLIGSSLTMHNLNAGELAFLYLHNDLEKVEEYVSFYDYIELLPKGAYNELMESDGTGMISGPAAIEEMNRYFYQLARTHEIPATASSNVHYLKEEDALLRNIIVYGSGSAYDKVSYMSDDKFWFRTTDELLREFDYLDPGVAREIVVTNTNRIAEAIDSVRPIPEGFFPPHLENAEESIRDMSYEKAHRIYGDPLPAIVEERLKKELDAIINNGFAVLYLSAQKLVKKSMEFGYLVGSRGSVGSSLVAFMMGITEVNALYPHYICDNPDCKYSEFTDKEGTGADLPEKNCPRCGAPLRRDGFTIPFEVFMGFDGDKVPDIDLNFSGECQSEIHRYCETLFGRENVFKAGTITTLAEKNAYGYIKKYHTENGLPVTNAHMERLSKLIDGAKKTTGQHPGGMIVLPAGTSIYDFCPVQKPANDQSSDSITTHFDYHEMDEQLVKLDILGHDDPTTIKLLQEYTGVDVYKIPLTDPETMKIFFGTESLGVTPEAIGATIGTNGIPEFGTSFVMEMLRETRPKTFAELVRISGLSHGEDVWLNNAKTIVESGVATLSDIITVRDDIMNYLIDQGLEKSEAFEIMEFVRKGKPSKDPEKWEKLSKKMQEKHVPAWYIESCKKIKYMFPKGHAVAYVMMAMRIAWFKVHYPLAFYAAYFSRKAEALDYELMRDIGLVREQIELLKPDERKLDPRKSATLTLCRVILEMHARGFSFLPIDIYKSEIRKFTIEDGRIRFPLIAMNGLGESVATKIQEERTKEEFLSFEDLKKRTQISGKVLEKLRKLGCVENLSVTNQKSLF
ncbi:MAG: PolC-type DNA polymerase III [Fusobacteriaceae bacterium]|jgi:DNA polymerase-3 subunit alpha (Gram-positive type)|nr:PolC-type DNA polymerase III [Fusobacteriaceae bacterium]